MSNGKTPQSKAKEWAAKIALERQHVHALGRAYKTEAQYPEYDSDVSLLMDTASDVLELASVRALEVAARLGEGGD